MCEWMSEANEGANKNVFYFVLVFFYLVSLYMYCFFYFFLLFLFFYIFFAPYASGVKFGFVHYSVMSMFLLKSELLSNFCTQELTTWLFPTSQLIYTSQRSAWAHCTTVVLKIVFKKSTCRNSQHPILTYPPTSHFCNGFQIWNPEKKSSCLSRHWVTTLPQIVLKK